MIAKFKEYHIPFAVLRKQDPIPLRTRIIITTASEARAFGSDKLVLFPSGGHGTDFIVARIKNYMKNITQIKSIVVGIDPGKRIGIIVLVNDMLIENHTMDIESFSRALKRILIPFEDHNITIRVGAGSHRYLSRILRTLHNLHGKFILSTEIVDERRTTRGGDSFGKFKLSPHEIAALHIAARSGESIDITRRIADLNHYTDGEISFVQERSRRASNGRVTISRLLAQRVLAGDLSLPQALDLQLQKKSES